MTKTALCRCLSFLLSLLTATLAEASYNPTYMMQRGGDFGGLQDDYLKRARRIIGKTEEMIQEAVKEERDLKELFFQVLDRMAKERNRIARDHGTEAAEEFGKRRDRGYFAHVVCTNFSNRQYREYGQQILERLQSILSQMKRNEKEFTEKKRVINSEFGGRVSSIEIEIFEAEDLWREGWFITPLAGKVPGWFPVRLFRAQPLNPAEQAEMFAAIKRLWKENAKQDQWLWRGHNLQTFWSLFPSYPQTGVIRNPIEWMQKLIAHRSVLVEAMVFLEIDGKREPLYGYLTWLHRDAANPKEDLLKRMLRDSSLLVLHQPQFVMDETLKDLSALFERIIRWDGVDLDEVKRLMALFRYEMSCMPFHRGSAAVSEWMEAALYGYHQIDFQLNGNRLVDLEVYSHPLLADFFAAYDAMHTLRSSLRKRNQIGDQ